MSSAKAGSGGAARASRESASRRGRPRRGDEVVYALHMSRTNVDVDDALVGRVMSRYGVSTKRAAIDLALRRLDLEPMSREEALAMQGSGWEGDLDELRGGWVRQTSRAS
jgi:Arc/MetJ family transcription regulator